jgi:hypothetical protein
MVMTPRDLNPWASRGQRVSFHRETSRHRRTIAAHGLGHGRTICRLRGVDRASDSFLFDSRDGSVDERIFDAKRAIDGAGMVDAQRCFGFADRGRDHDLSHPPIFSQLHRTVENNLCRRLGGIGQAHARSQRSIVFTDDNSYVGLLP